MDSFKSLRLEFCLPCSAIRVLAVAIVSIPRNEEPLRSIGIVTSDWRNNVVLGAGSASTAPGIEWRAQTSIHPRQSLLKRRKEALPPVLGALVGLLLIRPEARLLHAQVSPRPGRGESPGDDTLETHGRPGV